MSILLGVVGAIAASGEGGGFVTFSMLYGDDGGAYTGYSDGHTGSEGVGPSSSMGQLTPPTLFGQTVHFVSSAATVSPSEDSFGVAIAGNLSQDFFTSVDCDLGSFDTAVADTFTYNASGDFTLWVWLITQDNLFPSPGAGDVLFTG